MPPRRIARSAMTRVRTHTFAYTHSHTRIVHMSIAARSFVYPSWRSHVNVPRRLHLVSPQIILPFFSLSSLHSCVYGHRLACYIRPRCLLSFSLTVFYLRRSRIVIAISLLFHWSWLCSSLFLYISYLIVFVFIYCFISFSLSRFLFFFILSHFFKSTYITPSVFVAPRYIAIGHFILLWYLLSLSYSNAALQIHLVFYIVSAVFLQTIFFLVIMNMYLEVLFFGTNAFM